MCPSTYSHVLHFPKSSGCPKIRLKSTKHSCLSWHISVFNHTFVQFTLILDIILLKVFQQSTNHSVKSLLYCHSCLVVSSFHFVVFLYHHLVIQTLVIISCHPLECTVRITYYLVKGRRGWVSRTEMKTFSLPTAFHSSSTHSIAGMAEHSCQSHLIRS